MVKLAWAAIATTAPVPRPAPSFLLCRQPNPAMGIATSPVLLLCGRHSESTAAGTYDSQVPDSGARRASAPLVADDPGPMPTESYAALMMTSNIGPEFENMLPP
jgi:hypothetical protein